MLQVENVGGIILACDVDSITFALKKETKCPLQTEDEEKAKVPSAESLQPNQKPATATNTEKKKRSYVKKNQKNLNDEGSGQIKTKK
jgi:uncharacterized protein (DUF697 family)